MATEKAFVSWSGGKDCSLALYRALKSGVDARFLVNTVTEDGGASRSHGISANWLKMQAEAMGMSLVQQPTTIASYEADFKKAIAALKEKRRFIGIEIESRKVEIARGRIAKEAFS